MINLTNFFKQTFLNGHESGKQTPIIYASAILRNVEPNTK
jgi:hypothetical protein